jgi:hypothetical protein
VTLPGWVKDALRREMLTKQQKPSLEGRKLSLPVYGNHCGLGHGDPTGNTPPIDAVDAVCREHDLCYALLGDFDGRCDQDFVESMPSAIASTRLRRKSMRGFWRCCISPWPNVTSHSARPSLRGFSVERREGQFSRKLKQSDETSPTKHLEYSPEGVEGQFLELCSRKVGSCAGLLRRAPCTLPGKPKQREAPACPRGNLPPRTSRHREPHRRRSRSKLRFLRYERLEGKVAH